MPNLFYEAPPTLAAFMKSEAFGRIAAGPVGSGKTTACVIELLRRSMMQAPADDNVRYTRYAIVRQTLKQLRDTVLKDCEGWLRGLGVWKVSESTFHLNFNDVVSEWIFIPLEDATDQARLLSMQLTGAWLSEAIEMDLNVVGPVTERLGRYPSGALGAPTWHGLIADTNMPTEMSVWHQFMENLPPNWQKFIQPSGMASPIFNAARQQIGGAENLNYLLQTEKTKRLPLNHPVRLAQGRSYYENIIATHGEHSARVRRYVHAQYGDDPSGLAVFKDSFRPSFHIVNETNVIPGYPLLIGQDFGRNPWSLICQNDHLGRLIVHEEVPGTNIGLEAHIKHNLKPRLMQAKFLGMKIAVVGDPAGIAKDSILEENSIDVIQRLGLPAFPAPTNDIDPRLRAVEALLGQQTQGGPTLAINGPACRMLCRAMSGGYRFAKTKVGGLKGKPEKNDAEGYSHVVDALQYVALVVHGGMTDYITKRIYLKKRAPRPHVTPAGWT